jgi:hypothetical protein
MGDLLWRSHPLFFVSVADKGLSDGVSGLESRDTGRPVSVDSKGVCCPGQILADGFYGAGAGFFLGVVKAEVGMVAGAQRAATAAIGEGEQTRGREVLFTA